MFTYEYERPSLTADCIVFDRNYEYILLIKRKNEPFKDCWALPGGFMNMNEPLIETAKRELFEETDVKPFYPLQFVGMYDEANRDPRTRVITAVYYTHIPWDTCFKAKDDAVDISWIHLIDLKLAHMAFDHKKMIYDAEHMMPEHQRCRRTCLTANCFSEK